MAKKRKSRSGKACRIPFKISEAGHLLKTQHESGAGSYLSHEGKLQKQKRKKKGCLNGPAGTFKLTEKQKRKLPPKLQRAIIEHHRKLGKKIF